ASDPGDEFQQAFLSLYQSVKADPDHIRVDGATAKNLGSLLKTASSSSYQLKLDGDGHGHFLGAVVTGIENQVTRKMVPFKVHPWMLPGCALIRSETLPVPDSHISATAEVISVQEYMSVDWPVVQFTYDSSTYWYGTLVHYAPAWSGLICGIKSACSRPLPSGARFPRALQRGPRPLSPAGSGAALLSPTTWRSRGRRDGARRRPRRRCAQRHRHVRAGVPLPRRHV